MKRFLLAVLFMLTVGMAAAMAQSNVTIDLSTVQTDATAAMNTVVPLGVKIFAGLTAIGIALAVIRKFRRG